MGGALPSRNPPPPSPPPCPSPPGLPASPAPRWPAWPSWRWRCCPPRAWPPQPCWWTRRTVCPGRPAAASRGPPPPGACWPPAARAAACGRARWVGRGWREGFVQEDQGCGLPPWDGRSSPCCCPTQQLVCGCWGVAPPAHPAHPASTAASHTCAQQGGPHAHGQPLRASCAPAPAPAHSPNRASPARSPCSLCPRCLCAHVCVCVRVGGNGWLRRACMRACVQWPAA